MMRNPMKPTERLAWWIARRLPKKVVYWAVIRAGANYTTKVDTSIEPDEMGVKEWTAGALA